MVDSVPVVPAPSGGPRIVNEDGVLFFYNTSFCNHLFIYNRERYDVVLIDEFFDKRIYNTDILYFKRDFYKNMKGNVKGN